MEEATEPHTSTAPALEDLAPFFPGYEFEGFIAEGGMGWVYQARQISLDRPVAIKILQRELGADPEFRKSFEAEAKAMARLNHPNLIGVYDFGDADGLPYIIMEMVNGKSLHHSAYGRTIDPIQAGKLVSAISRGLANAHKAGILHRDIKPGNILLDAEATPKIGDFGLAQPMDQKTGADEPIYGTPGYTAPEVYHRQGDHRADIFSVGVLLHELLIGRLPQPEDPPPSVTSGCSREMDNIVARSTNPNPAARYNTVEELADDLDKAIANQSASASSSRLVMPSSAPRPVQVARAAPATTATLATPVAVAAAGSPAPANAVNRAKLQAHAQKKSPALLIGIICGILGLIVIIVIASSGGKDTPSDPTPPTWNNPEPLKPDTGNQSSTGDDSKRRRDDGKRPRDKKPKRSDKTDTTDPKPEVVVEAKPSPMDSLATLKGALASGDRETYPAGIEARNGSHFVLADLAMSWSEAKNFAEEHGAHLAVLPSADDRKWFAEKFPSEEPVWLGAGMAAADKWQWLDGTAFDSGSTVPTEDADQRFVSMLPGGGFAARANAELLQVALQWRDDGSNPATTEEQLRRTAEQVKAGGVAGATFPVGTRTYAQANSHFFNLTRGISWDEARILATKLGGYLAVPSTAEEAVWIADSFSHLTGADAVLWIGGFRLKSGSWQWLNREAWNHSAGWAGGAEPASSPDARLLHRFGESGGWGPSDGKTGGAFGLLIEWSPPKKAATITSFDLDEWQAEIDGRYTALVQADIAEWRKENKLIIDRYVRNIERLGRKYKSALSGRDGQDRIRDAIDEAVRDVKKNERLLSEVPSAAPDEFHELQKKSEKAVAENDDDFEKKLNAHLASYTQALAKQSTELAENGFDSEAASITERLTLVKDSAFQFLTVLGEIDPTGRSKPPEPEEEEDKDGDDKDDKE